MNKVVIVLIIIVGLAMGGASIYSFVQPKPTEKVVAQDEITQTVKKSNKAISTTSRYLTYSPQILGGTKDKKRVLFFYASWCPTCIPTDAAFTNNTDQIPEDVVIIRVNYNDSDTDADEKSLAKKYGITYQHTFVQIDMQGNQITKWNGGQLEELQMNIQ